MRSVRHKLPFPGEKTVLDAVESSTKLRHCFSLEDEASGIVLLAPRSRAQAVADLFDRREVKKSYHALVAGHPEWDEKSFDFPCKGGRAVTSVRVLRRGFWINAGCDAQAASLVTAWTWVGLTQQVRSHLKMAGFPVLGERERDNHVLCHRLFLHLSRLDLVSQVLETEHGFDAYLVDLKDVRHHALRPPEERVAESLGRWGVAERVEAVESGRVAQVEDLINSRKLSVEEAKRMLAAFPEWLTDYTPKQVWANGDFSVLCKTFNRLVYRKQSHPQEWSIVDWLRTAFSDPWILCHRLDYGTSGALLLTKTKEGARLVNTLFEAHKVKKVYHALVFGAFPQGEVCLDDALDGYAAETTVRLERRGTFDGRPASLVEALPKTGRTHQIRKHLMMAGFPIIGDTEYAKAAGVLAGCYRLCLHASQIHVPLPEPVTVTVPHAFERMLVFDPAT